MPPSFDKRGNVFRKSRCSIRFIPRTKYVLFKFKTVFKPVLPRCIKCEKRAPIFPSEFHELHACNVTVRCWEIRQTATRFRGTTTDSRCITIYRCASRRVSDLCATFILLPNLLHVAICDSSNFFNTYVPTSTLNSVIFRSEK